MKKTKNTLARIVAAAVGACALLMAGIAQAALQDRDLDGDSVVDAFYDTDFDITWLRDADVNGRMRRILNGEPSNAVSAAAFSERSHRNEVLVANWTHVLGLERHQRLCST